MGVLPGVIGTLMASEALKLLLGIGAPLIGRLLTFDALSGHFREFAIAPDPNCAWCHIGARPPPHVDYAQACAAE
jgi:molybdopterin/thiamine biosynthesis adenylyltransferase